MVTREKSIERINLANGTRNEFNPYTSQKGTWRTHAVVPSTDLMKVKKNLKPEYASIASVVPCTAYRLLHDFVNLQPGDTIVQNGGNSQVAMAVAQLAALKGVKSINIIRDR